MCLEGRVNNNLYKCRISKVITHTVNIVNACQNENFLYKWHRRLGHRNINHIKDLVNKDLVTGIQVNDCKHENVCEICIKCKLTNNPYPKSTNFRARQILELVHSDVCGQMQTATVRGEILFPYLC